MNGRNDSWKSSFAQAVARILIFTMRRIFPSAISEIPIALLRFINFLILASCRRRSNTMSSRSLPFENLFSLRGSARVLDTWRNKARCTGASGSWSTEVWRSAKQAGSKLALGSRNSRDNSETRRTIHAYRARQHSSTGLPATYAVQLNCLIIII